MDKITAADLEESGLVIQKLFETKYPEGLTLEEMQEEGRKYGWVNRALLRLQQAKE